MRTPADAHREIARALEFPETYGANLDALWDMISALEADAALTRPAPMLNALGVYGCKLLQTFFEAARDNPDFRFRIIE